MVRQTYQPARDNWALQLKTGLGSETDEYVRPPANRIGYILIQPILYIFYVLL